jgi:hypothetical protein
MISVRDNIIHPGFDTGTGSTCRVAQCCRTRKNSSSSTVGQRERRATTEQGAIDHGETRSKGTDQQRTSLCDHHRSER